MNVTKEAALQAIRDLAARGDLATALARGEALVAGQPADASALNLLGDLYARAGDAAAAAARYRQAADHLRAEGFLPKAAALYRKLLKLVPDEAARWALADVLREQGLSREAREHLAALEQQRREAGDVAGARECLDRLEAWDAEKFPAHAARGPSRPPRAPTSAPAEGPDSPAAELLSPHPPDEARAAGVPAAAVDDSRPAPALEAVFEQLRREAEGAPDASAELDALYALAVSQQDAGDSHQAVITFLKLEARWPAYRDTRQRIAMLTSPRDRETSS